MCFITKIITTTVFIKIWMKSSPCEGGIRHRNSALRTAGQDSVAASEIQARISHLQSIAASYDC
jgi:hypothetical protein